MNKLTLQRNIDNGYGIVFCIQKQEFLLSDIHEYFKDALFFLNHSFDFSKPFENIQSVVLFLKTNWEVLQYGAIMTDLEETDILEYFNSTVNPNGYGNTVDCLVLIYNNEILFNSEKL